MKTSNSITRNVKNIFVLTALCSSVFLMSSCKKNEPIQPGSLNTVANELKQIAPPEKVFTMLKINHYSMRTSLPDYSVEMNNNGLVTYTGRNNVAVKGQRQISVSSETVSKIYKLFTAIDLVQSPNDLASNHFIGPFNMTVFNDGIHGSKSAIDYNNYPADVISRRIKAEEILKISGFVKSDAADVNYQEEVH